MRRCSFSLLLAIACLLLLFQITSFVYADEPVPLNPVAAWLPDDNDDTYSVAWGDIDGDGDLDLAVGNCVGPDRIYLNEGGILQTDPAWTSGDDDCTNSMAWGDVDGDGDLDLAAGNSVFGGSSGPIKIYLNEGGVLRTTAAWTFGNDGYTGSVAWGDVDGDGDLDLAVGNAGGPNKVYLNEGSVLQTVAACWTLAILSYVNYFTQNQARNAPKPPSIRCF